MYILVIEIYYLIILNIKTIIKSTYEILNTKKKI